MQTHARSERSTWIIILMMVLFILGKGLLVYPVPDVPGESPYAIYEPLPHRQHVRGRMGE